MFLVTEISSADETHKKKKSREFLAKASQERPLPLLTIASDVAKKMVDGVLSILGLKPKD